MARKKEVEREIRKNWPEKPAGKENLEKTAEKKDNAL